MKEYLILILMVIVVFSCDKDDDIAPNFFNGFATAKFNEEELNLKPRMTYFPSLDSYGLLLEYHVNENILRKQLSFSYIVGETGRKLVYAYDSNRKDTLQVSHSTLIADGDVAGGYYRLNEMDSIEDYIELTKFNNFSGEVIGRFQGSFYLDTTKTYDLSSPDTVIITDGYFETKIYE